jgi:tRNA 2-thiouridine synthesizing protein D
MGIDRMANMTTLLLLTSAPESHLAWHAVRLARALLSSDETVRVFFYQDAVSVVNALRWQPADEPSLQTAWQTLDIDLPVCVSAALNRGISDHANASRHQLPHANLATGFRLTGLGELAELMIQADRVVQL